jgi:hypothetical protein
MVTKPNLPTPKSVAQSGPTPPMKTPTKIAPPTQVGGVTTSGAGLDNDLANRDRSGDNKFKLPEKVTQQEIKDGSFKYGGGRSAGNRSLADNKARHEEQP